MVDIFSSNLIKLKRFFKIIFLYYKITLNLNMPHCGYRIYLLLIGSDKGGWK